MAGRPKRVFSEDQVREIERMARDNCNTNTIAVALDIPFKTLQRHFGKKLRLGRALWKTDLRQAQNKLKDTSADMCKFLGVNELGQQVKQTITTEQPKTNELTPAEDKAVQAAAAAYKAAMARSEIKTVKGAG